MMTLMVNSHSWLVLFPVFNRKVTPSFRVHVYHGDLFGLPESVSDMASMWVA